MNNPNNFKTTINTEIAINADSNSNIETSAEEIIELPKNLINRTEIQYIPITLSMFSNFLNELFYTAITFRYAIDRYFTICSKDNHSTSSLYVLDETKKHLCREKSGATRKMFDKTFNAIMKTREADNSIVFTNEYVCLMPIEVWDRWANWVLTKSTRERNTYTKLYLYMYLGCDAFYGKFQIGVERIAAQLQMNTKDVCRKLHKIEAAGFLIAGKYIPMIMARNYIVREEDESFLRQQRRIYLQERGSWD